MLYGTGFDKKLKAYINHLLKTANNFYDSRKMAVGLSCKFTKLSQGCRKNSCSHPYDKEKKCKAVARMLYHVRASIVQKMPVSKTFENRAKSYVNPAFVMRLSYGSRTVCKNRRNNVYVENLTYDAATTVRRCKFVGLSCGYRTDFCDFCQKDNRI